MNNDAETINGRRAQLSGLEKYGLLLMGIFLIILSGGRFVTPSAAFLAPIFLLRFTRNTSCKVGISILYVLLFLSLLVRLHDYVAVPRPLNLVLIAGIALLEVLPFLIDRKLFNRLPALLGSLVLPCAFVVLAFIASAVLPIGSMGDKAYSQVGNYELMQLLSVTGIHGIAFVIFWFAAVMAFLWDSGFAWRRSRSQVVLLLLCMMIIFVSGGFRNVFDENESDTVRIAGVVGNQTQLLQGLAEHGVVGGLSGLSVAADYPADKVNEVIGAHHNDLLQRTKNEAIAGASIVSWAEADGVVFRSAEPALVARVSEAARTAGIYVVATFAVVDDPSDAKIRKPIENKLVVFGPQGMVLGQYTKKRSLWNDHYTPGNNEMLLLDTEFGELAFAIGFDLDFPGSIRMAGDADIIISPASDWRTLSPHHSLMATFRGVENGVALFRPTRNGMSIASDSHGRILAQTDHFRAAPHALVASVPTGGVSTLYSVWGDWFAWLNVALLPLLLIVAFRAGRDNKDQLGSLGHTDADDVRERSRITAIQWRDSERDNHLDRNG